VHIKPQIFYIVVHKYGKGAQARWRVNYWAPHNIIAVPAPY
jgi:hypothetical protein